MSECNEYGQIYTQILKKGKHLELGTPWIINATTYKAGLHIIDQEDLYSILLLAKADFPKMYVAHPNVLEFYAWFEKWFGDST
jgi:hypothetical protein